MSFGNRQVLFCLRKARVRALVVCGTFLFWEVGSCVCECECEWEGESVEVEVEVNLGYHYRIPADLKPARQYLVSSLAWQRRSFPSTSYSSSSEQSSRA